MAFERQQPVTPVKAADIVTTLFDPDPTGEERQSATVSIQVVMSDGTVKIVNANIADHFPTSALNQLIGFAASVRKKAEEELLPE